MDWLEECAEKLRQYVRNTTVVRAAAAYLLAALAVSLACTRLTVNVMSLWINVMLESVPVPEEKMRFLTEIEQLCPWFYMTVSIVVAGRFFIQNKMKAALAEIEAAVKHMAAGDLSYEMAWQSKDEFGLLAKDVEQLRETVKKDKLDQWKMGEEQRRINAAFAHDIRTPLTVMNGYTEFLKKYVPTGKVTEQVILEKLDRISEQGERLLSFSKTMTTLQTMEKWEIHCRKMEAAEICKNIKDMAEGMKGEEAHLFFRENTEGTGSVLADLELILEAVGNVLQNACRYARKEIEITVQYRKNRLTVYVRDDGDVFSEKALREAAAVYFRERKEGEAQDGHFGIGLSITKMLCEKHGGELKLFNSVEGGAVAAVSFLI